MEKLKIAVEVMGIGDTMVDLFTRASTLPPRGGNIWSSAVSLSPGGTTANVAANIAKLGIHSGFTGCVGDEHYGKYFIEEFEKIDVDTRGIKVKPGIFTGIVLAIIDDTGERTLIACAKGSAYTALSLEDIETIDFNAFPVMHTSGVCLVEEPSCSAILLALEHARKAGCLIYYDPNLRLEGNYFSPQLRKANWKAISLSNIVLIGDEEMELIFPGQSLTNGVKQILETGVSIVAVKQGEKGATVFGTDYENYCPAYSVPVSSTLGAGDSFDAGFIAARCRNANLNDALHYACAVAAIKVTREGSRSVPGHTETLAFLADRGELVQSITRE